MANTLHGLDDATVSAAERNGFDSLFITPVTGIDGKTGGFITVLGLRGSPPAASLSGVSEVVTDLVAAALRIRGRFDRLEKTARSDPLTGLANRAAFEEALAANATASQLAILYIDLDYFKTVNDTHGHLVGDQLLEIMGRRLGGAVREGDLVARLGGDEFAVLCPSCDSDEAVQIAHRILDAVAETVTVEDHELTIGASIGVAHAPVAADDLLRRADDALYEAKNAGRGTVKINRAY